MRDYVVIKAWERTDLNTGVSDHIGDIRGSPMVFSVAYFQVANDPGEHKSLRCHSEF